MRNYLFQCSQGSGIELQETNELQSTGGTMVYNQNMHYYIMGRMQPQRILKYPVVDAREANEVRNGCGHES